MIVAILTFVWLAAMPDVKSARWAGLVSSRPFLNLGSFQPHTIFTASSIVAVTYGGFDGARTLAPLLVIGSLGSALTAQTGVARLLYRTLGDGSLPVFFSRLDVPTALPLRNILLVGLLARIGALLLNYERSAELINLGAFLAFMGVKAAVVRHSHRAHFAEPGHGRFTGIVLPLAGLFFCFSIWRNLSIPAKIVGGELALDHLIQSCRTDAVDATFDFSNT
jgi:amino acid transporter